MPNRNRQALVCWDPWDFIVLDRARSLPLVPDQNNRLNSPGDLFEAAP